MRVRPQCVFRHQLPGDRVGRRRVDAAPGTDAREFADLGVDVARHLGPLARNIGALGIRLRADRDIFACRHRHRAGDQPCGTGDKNVGRLSRRRSDANDQARGGDDAVVGAEHGGAQPADPGTRWRSRCTGSLVIVVFAFAGFSADRLVGVGMRTRCKRKPVDLQHAKGSAADRDGREGDGKCGRPARIARGRVQIGTLPAGDECRDKIVAGEQRHGDDGYDVQRNQAEQKTTSCFFVALPNS